MSNELELDAWRRRLAGRGHACVASEESEATTFGVRPDVDTIFIVAVEPDVSLGAAYQQRYFLCPPEPEQVFRLVSCPEMHCNRWVEAVTRQPDGYWHDFLAGPGAWTLARLARFPTIVAWSERGLEWPALDHPFHREWGIIVPASVAHRFATHRGPEALRPLIFRSDDEQFAEIVAACFLFASVGMRDCYLADANGTEVYLAHHHDQVFVSIPDAAARQVVVQELTKAAWLFKDDSDYSSSTDDGPEG